MSKSDEVNRTFVESYDVEDYEILTDEGWADITKVFKTVEHQMWEVKTSKHELKCADDHIMFNETYDEVFAKELKPGDKIITEDGPEEVVSAEDTGKQEQMYDLQLADGSKHRYFSNGILSHNSTMYCIYALWLSCFSLEKKIMILANKAAIALELLGKIEMGYQYLPHWLKPACLTFNKGEIAFSNLSAIRAFASSSDAARGFSANCISGDSKVTIRLFKIFKMSIKIKYLQMFGISVA